MKVQERPLNILKYIEYISKQISYSYFVLPKRSYLTQGVELWEFIFSKNIMEWSILLSFFTLLYFRTSEKEAHLKHFSPIP